MSGYLEQPQLHTKAPHRAALLTYPGNLKKALKLASEDQANSLFGIASGIPSVFYTKVLASTRPDFIFIDVEHGMFNRLELHDTIQAINFHSEGQSLAIVRVPAHDEISLTTALDAGAAGIIIPHVESAEDVKNFISRAYYPPMGKRSFSPWTFAPGVSNASLYENDAFNMKTSNNHVAIIPQIESVKGVKNADEIAAVDGVDAMMFGPGDFMADAGIPLQLGGVPDPRFLEAMGKFCGAGIKYNRPLLTGAQSIDQVPMLIQSGFRVICVAFDVWAISNLMHGNLTKARGFLKEEVEKSQKKVVTNGHSNGSANGAANGTS